MGLYSPKDSLVLNAKRRTIAQMTTEQAKTQSWTLAGRLVCDTGDRPPVNAMPFPVGLPPHLLKERVPTTRMEVTEQRLINQAAGPPPKPPQFTIEARGPASASRGRPSSARGGSSGAAST